MNYLPGVFCIVIGLTWTIGVFWTTPEPPPPEATIELHISYNSTTDDRSKFMEGDEYILMGTTRDARLYRCTVSKVFWEMATQNNHYAIPESQCKEIKP